MHESFEEFVRRKNIENLERQLDAAADEGKRRMVRTLLAEEQEKERQANPSEEREASSAPPRPRA